MITQPTSTLLAELVDDELAKSSTLDEASLREVHTLTDGLLGVIARREANQEDWMRAEIDQIRGLLDFLRSQDIIAPTPDAPAIDDADDLAERYRRLSAALADAVAPAMRAGGEARRRLDDVVATRVEHERAIRGDLVIVRG